MTRLDTCTPALQRFLARDRVATLNISGILENEPQVEIFVDDGEDPKGVLVQGPWFRYVHAEEDAFLEELFREMDQKEGFYQFSGVWRPIADKIKARFNLVWEAPCDLYHLPTGRSVAPRADSRATSVDLKDAEIIDEHYAYKNDHSLEKIRKCIRYRPSSAIYVDGELACWLLVHEDNSLGIMYTMEKHRRKGFALEVSLDLVAKQLAAGKTPFLQIRDDNAMSPGLAKKCGFVPYGGCDWFGVIVGTPLELIEGGLAFRSRVLESGNRTEGLPEYGLYRFLYAMKPGPLESNPVLEATDDEEWLEFVSRHFDPAFLRTSLERLRKDYRLLCERRDGVIIAAAALLLDDDDGFELLWCTSRDQAFLRHVLEWAKIHHLGTVITHVNPGERAVFEELGFRAASPGG